MPSFSITIIILFETYAWIDNRVAFNNSPFPKIECEHINKQTDDSDIGNFCVINPANKHSLRQIYVCFLCGGCSTTENIWLLHFPSMQIINQRRYAINHVHEHSELVSAGLYTFSRCQLI